jgi:hypothetical protein
VGQSEVMDDQRADVTDPFLSALDMPALEDVDAGASTDAMVWPIPSPRVRKLLEARLEDLGDQHFYTRITAIGLAAVFFVVGGAGIYLIVDQVIGYRISPIYFGVAYTVFYVALASLSEFMRERTPIERYRRVDFSHSSFIDEKQRRGLRGFPRLLLFVPGMAGKAFRKLSEPSPPSDEEALEVALRLLPALHSPLLLVRAESADLGGPEVVRRAVLLLHGLGLADLRPNEDGEYEVVPCGGCADLLRGGPFDPDKIGDFETTIRD